MRTLNLANSEESDIKFKIQKFPDGQQNIVIKVSNTELKLSSVKIVSRFNNWLDLELIACAATALRKVDKRVELHLYTPYILGARSDREFDPDKEGYVGNHYLRDVVCPILNSLNFETIICVDPHSFILETLISNLVRKNNTDLVKWSLFNFQLGLYPDMLHKPEYLDKFILMAPDAGAGHKIYKLAESIGYKGDIITCSKERDINGGLNKCVVPMGKYWNSDKDIVIVDDICDGGATFINIAKELKNNGYIGKIYLIVTHGIFSKGFEELSKYFDGIYCTNSYQNVVIGNPGFLKQLNIF